jgi:hypothetical protein
MADDLYQQTLSADGYAIGSDPCLDQCWADFRRCLNGSTDSNECMARLQACKRACAARPPTTDADPQSDDSATA